MKQTNIPSYLSKSQDDLLTLLHKHYIGIGSANQQVVNLFLQLCKSDSDIIQWDTLSNFVDTTFEFDTQDIYQNIQTLQDSELAIIRHKPDLEKLSPTYIRLCDKKSTIFYCESITEQLIKTLYSTSIPLTFESEFMKKDKHMFSQTTIVPFENHAQDIYLESAQDLYNPIIYSLNLKTNMIYFTNFSFPHLNHIIINKLQHLLSFSGDELFTQLSKLAHISHHELQQNLTNSNLENLYTIATTLEFRLKAISTNQIMKKYTDFQELMCILYHILPLYLKYQKTRKLENKKIQEYTNIIIEDIKKNKIYTKSQFDTLLTNTLESIYEERDTIIQEQQNFLSKNIILSKDITTIDTDVLIDLNTHYVYAPHITDLLIESYPLIKEKCSNHIIHQIQKFLTGKIVASQAMFFDKTKLEVLIRQFLFQEFPLYYTISKIPQLVWIALHSNHTSTEVQNNNLFFLYDLKRHTLLPWNEIFDINLKLCYLKAKQRLNYIEKIIMIFKKTNQKFFRMQKQALSKKNHAD